MFDKSTALSKQRINKKGFRNHFSREPFGNAIAVHYLLLEAFFFAFFFAVFFFAAFFLVAFFFAAFFFTAFFFAFLAAFFFAAFFAAFFLAGFLLTAGATSAVCSSGTFTSVASRPQQYTGSSYTSPVLVTSIFLPHTLHSYCIIFSIPICIPLLIC